MKRFNFIGFVAVYMVMTALLAIHFHPSDRQIQRKLTGTWVLPMSPGRTNTIVIVPDGSFVSQVSGVGDDSTFLRHGKMSVRDGTIVVTWTMNNKTMTLHWHVIRLDSHELVWRSDKGFTDGPYYKVGI